MSHRDVMDVLYSSVYETLRGGVCLMVLLCCVALYKVSGKHRDDRRWPDVNNLPPSLVTFLSSRI